MKSGQAFWPAMPAKPRERTMAVALLNGNLRVGGEGLVECATWREFTAALELHNLDCVVEDLARWRWWPDATDCPKAWVTHGRDGHPRAVTWQGRKRRFAITLATVWGGRHADRSLCRDLERVAEATGIGQWPTPARLGDALQRRAWKDAHGWRWESRPARPARALLLEHGVGGRWETAKVGGRFQHVWEIDQRDAYAAAWALPKPSGPAIMVAGVCELPEGIVTAYGPLEFTIKEELGCLGPLPIRQELLSWPTKPGTYQTWAWAEEVEDARSCGVEVRSTGTAMGWGKWVEAPEWTREISSIRRQAGGWGSLVKLATVAAIGRHGRAPSAWVEARDRSQAGIAYGGAGKAYRKRSTDPSACTHWYAYAIMQARRRVWHRGVAEQQAGRRVWAVETDSLILDGPPLGPVVKRGDDLPGEWTVRREDDEVETAANRWALFSDGTGRTPGLPAAGREAWLAAHAPPLVA